MTNKARADVPGKLSGSHAPTLPDLLCDTRTINSLCLSFRGVSPLPVLFRSIALDLSLSKGVWLQQQTTSVRLNVHSLYRNILVVFFSFKRLPACNIWRTRGCPMQSVFSFFLRSHIQGLPACSESPDDMRFHNIISSNCFVLFAKHSCSSLFFRSAHTQNP